MTTSSPASPSPSVATSTATAAPTPTPAPAPAPVSTTTSTGTPTAPQAPAASAATVLREVVAVEPGDRLPLVPATETVVHPSSTFEAELSVRAPDARLVLVDARDDQVAAAGTRELSPSRTRLTLAPSAPLTPGSRYALRLDGAVERELHDDGGRAYAGLTLPLLVAGTPPPPQPKKPERKRRRR